jgi:hypothetical protein
LVRHAHAFAGVLHTALTSHRLYVISKLIVQAARHSV